MEKAIDKILLENSRRLAANNAPFNPVTGEGSTGRRFKFSLPDFPVPVQHLPEVMRDNRFIKRLKSAGTIDAFIDKVFGLDPTPELRHKVVDTFVRLRSKHDFPFWAATFIRILSKRPGEGEIPFRLTRPQRRFVEALEDMRANNLPIRMILLKARQWGGSTTSQLYMAWLQLVHKVGLNSVIVSQTKKTSFAIKAMYDRALKSYPLDMMYPPGTPFDPRESKMVNVGQTGDYKKIPQRDCTITIASYEAPDALRGDAYALVHCSEVGLWSPTEQKSPDLVVRSACSGILLEPYTMIIYESTANGTGNFFYNEYHAARDGQSQFRPLFISWFDIDIYQLPLTPDEERELAEWLWTNRKGTATSTKREEPGSYLWWLWEQGATLQGIKWYIAERAGKDSHAVMAAEYPTDDIEAFVHSGTMIFDRNRVETLRPACRPPLTVGEVSGDADSGAPALRNLRFNDDSQGLLWVWQHPEIDPAEKVLNRYLTVVDIGGRSHKADWSVIAVFDRIFMADGGKPELVAQWRGHIDHDLLAWKAAQIAAYYDNSLLVIESNTLETKDRERALDGDQSQFILNQIGDIYPNLYMRSAPEDNIIDGAPRKYGFHTNVNTKPMIISTLIRAVREGSYIERDDRCLFEFLKYEKKQNGSFGAIKGEHDDLLMTRAIGLHICFYEMELPRIIAQEPQSRFNKANRIVSEASF